MANYSINPAAAQEVAGEMVAVTNQLEQSLQTLTGWVNKFIVANNGQAPEAYSIAQQKWNEGQQRMHEALNLGQQRLQEIAANYVSGDNRGAAIFS